MMDDLQLLLGEHPIEGIVRVVEGLVAADEVSGPLEKDAALHAAWAMAALLNGHNMAEDDRRTLIEEAVKHLLTIYYEFYYGGPHATA